MPKSLTIQTVFYAVASVLWALPASAQCSSGNDCPQQYEDCACPAKMGRGEDCACPAVKTVVTRDSDGCVSAATKSGECDNNKPIEYTTAPKAEEFVLSDRQKLFDDSVDAEGRVKKNVKKDKDGSIFGGGPCVSCNKNGSIFGGAPCDGPACRPEKVNPKYIQNYVLYDDSLYNSVHRQCGDFAPLELEWVDFRIKNGMSDQGYSRKLGKYRFRIFGCRRNTRNAVLNEGRILEKDMSFIEIFDDMVSDCYKVIKTPNDLCLRADSPLPEYVLTAEISDYYMNLCDEYNWDEAKNADKRVGSSEMTVIWRLMDLTKTNVLWKGKSVGYGEVEEGEYNGEIVLIERAFADAVDNLRNLPGFEEQLAKRLSPEELQRQRDILIDTQRRMDPVKCQFSDEIKIMENSGSVSSGYGMNEGWINIPEAKVASSQKNTMIQSAGNVSEKSGAVSAGTGANAAANGSKVQMVNGKIVENSGVVSSGTGANAAGNSTQIEMVDGEIIEDSGIISSGIGAVAAGSSAEIQRVAGKIVENSGVVSSGIGSVESSNATELQMVSGEIVENSGSVSAGSGALQSSNRTELQMVNGEIVENSGASSEGYGVVSGSSAGEVIGNGVVTVEGVAVSGVAENSGAVSDGSSMYEVEAVDPEIHDMSALIEQDKLCIREQPDYDNMGPENVYKVRTAVVSVTNAKGKRGAGLIISELFVMTSADLVDRANNVYALETINGKKLKARAFRINPKKNTALLVLDQPTEYTPLSLNLELPAVNKDDFMTLGLLNFAEGGSEGYLETGGKVSGYRYDEDGTSQIVIDTFVQSATIGGVLIDEKGRITGMAHTVRPIKDGPDVFLPVETAMKSLGVGICGKAFPTSTPKPHKSWRQKSVAPLIEETVQKAPEVMSEDEMK